MKKESWCYLVAFLSGVVAWLVVSWVTGKTEAWDSSEYFTFVIPAMCLVAFFLALFAPERPSRWALMPFAGQLLTMLVAGDSFGLLPLGVIAFGILSVPAILAARAGAYLGRKSGSSDG
jgi:hypothetical protein